MYMCMTEKQKQTVEQMDMQIIEFKRAVSRLVESLKQAFDNLISVFRRISNAIAAGIPKIRKDFSSKERYKLVKQLSRCGFDEKQVSLMVHSAVVRCRNSC